LQQARRAVAKHQACKPPGLVGVDISSDPVWAEDYGWFDHMPMNHCNAPIPVRTQEELSSPHYIVRRLPVQRPLRVKTGMHKQIISPAKGENQPFQEMQMMGRETAG
jgi:hypothetical protein